MTAEGGMGNGPIVVIVLLFSSVWFGNQIFRSIDRFYKPSVQKWLERKPPTSAHLAPFADSYEQCMPHDDCDDIYRRQREAIEEEYSRKVDQLIESLTHEKGLTGPDPQGAKKAKVKAKFLAKMKALNEGYKAKKAAIAEQEQKLLLLRKQSSLRPGVCVVSSTSKAKFLQSINLHWCPAYREDGGPIVQSSSISS